MNKKRKQFGFTLVELLAVIVLLGLVSVIAFPRILEAIDKSNKKMDDSQLSLLYQGAERYLKKEENIYPWLEGNTFCIKPSKLEEENYIRYERKDDKDDYVVSAIITENGKANYSYVNKYECIEKGVVVANLGKVNCEVEKSGYAASKTVKIQYPLGEGYVYSYSFDGENWNIYKDKDGSGLQEIDFQSGGMVIARVRKEDGSGGYQSCTARVTQIDSEEVGSVIPYIGEEIPKGYILADGKAISRKSYYELYKVIGVMYGSGDGSTTFNLPNVEGRVIVGQSKNGSYSGIGDIGGELTHTLTIGELASHTHTFNGDKHKHTFVGRAVTSGNNSVIPTAGFTGYASTTSSAGAHTHNVEGYGATLKSGSTGWRYGKDGSKTGTGLIITAGAHTHAVTFAGTVSLAGTTHTHSVVASGTISEDSVSGTNSSIGGNKEHNNLMPYNTLKYIIKYQ